MIGAYQDDHTDAGGNAGSAYVFTKVSGVWSQVAKLTASDGDTSDEFGYSVAVSGETVVVGAHLDDHTDGDGDTDDDEGAAYVFTKPFTGWADMTQTAKLTAFGAAASDEFGISVAVDGNTVLVGAHQYQSGKGAATSSPSHTPAGPTATRRPSSSPRTPRRTTSSESPSR